MAEGFSKSETAVLARFQEKCQIVGAAAAGYIMRIQAIEFIETYDPELNAQEGVDDLVSKGLLQANEDGDRYLLTEEGATLLEGSDA